jgi:molybdopterin-guanine dinucleotide biosynthesis protein A
VFVAVRRPRSQTTRRRLAEPIGVVLAGGLGRRIGGAKATVELDHRPLLSYPLEAISAVLPEVAITAKPDSELPSAADSVAGRTDEAFGVAAG